MARKMADEAQIKEQKRLCQNDCMRNKRVSDDTKVQEDQVKVQD